MYVAPLTFHFLVVRLSKSYRNRRKKSDEQGLGRERQRKEGKMLIEACQVLVIMLGHKFWCFIAFHSDVLIIYISKLLKY